VDRDVLVIAGCAAGLVEVGRKDLRILRINTASRAVPAPELLWRGVAIEDVAESCRVVVFYDARPVRAVGELEVEYLRVLLRLLKAVGREPILAFRLDNG
jgi:hypothetical protein